MTCFLRQNLVRKNTLIQLLVSNIYFELRSSICQQFTVLHFFSVCQLIENEVIGVIGLDLKNLDDQVASILSFVGIPFLQANPSLSWDNEKSQFNSTINFYPSRKVLSEAVIDFIDSKAWDPVTIFYDQVQDILLWAGFLSRTKSASFLQPKFVQIPKTQDEIMSLLLKFKGQASTSTQQNVILFTADVSKVEIFLTSCQSSGLLNNANTNLLIASLVSL